MRGRLVPSVRRPSTGTVLGLLALVVSLSGVAWAAIPDAGGSVTGCYNMRTGLLRVVDAEAGASCTAAEKRVVLAGVDSGGKVADADLLDGLDSTAYRLSCPAGTGLFLGLCFEDGFRAAATHSPASRDCADEGRRLPSEGEMRSYRTQAGVTVAPFEWTDELSDTDVDSTFLYAVVGSGGSAIATSGEDEYPYRCVAGPTG